MRRPRAGPRRGCEVAGFPLLVTSAARLPCGKRMRGGPVPRAGPNRALTVLDPIHRMDV